MKIEKCGYRRNKGFSPVADSELHPGKDFDYGVPTWQSGAQVLRVCITGVEGPSTWDYFFYLSATELALMIESALTGGTKDAAIHAHAKAIGAFIREALHTKRKKRNHA